MKKIYFYDVTTGLLKLTPPMEVSDSFKILPGVTFKKPDISKRARYSIRFNGERWIYELRDTLLWTSITDTPAHKERQVYYNAALHYYFEIRLTLNGREEGFPYSNPEDLIPYLEENKDKVKDIKEDASGLKVEEVIKWIKDYESKKDLNSF